jgi:hypothetical protein
MKDHETVQRFIQLRAEGYSFARIASELNVSKTTLINWSRVNQFEIANLRAIETEALAEKCFASRQQRWERIAQDLQRIEQELAGRNLDNVPTASLMHLASKLRAEAAREMRPLRFSVPARDYFNSEFYKDVLDWQV